MDGRAATLFRRKFAREPQIVVRAPGRVNLIGEHTDYNGGFVLPAAIDLSLELAAGLRPDGQLAVHSGQPADARPYVQGVARTLGATAGLNVAIDSRIPAGAGLSSSAALELATARAICALEQREWQPREMAQACQRAEHDYAGSRCGIMDQLAVALGRAGEALLIDCRSLDIRPVPLPAGLALVVCDSARPRQLVESAYNERRADCEKAAALLGLPLLRDATEALLGRLPDPLRGRAQHVVQENQRVLAMEQALLTGDLDEAGQLLLASHASLRDLYEVSCPELDLLVELARGLPGCYGARLTGAGFGGCTINAVAAGQADAFAASLANQYRRRSGLPGRAWVCRAAAGVRVV